MESEMGPTGNEERGGGGLSGRSRGGIGEEKRC